MSRFLSRLVVVGLLSLVISGFPLPGAAQTPQVDMKTIDWQKQVVRVKGIGAPNLNLPLPQRRPTAIRAAKTVARRNLLEAIQEVTLTSETVVRNHMVENDVIRTKIEGVIKGAQFGEPKYYDDGTVGIDCWIVLTGTLSEALLYTQPPTGSSSPSPWFWNRQPVPSPPTGTAAPPAYTGLIVDARGLGVRPALAPKIWNQSGQELYSAATVSREFALKWGVVGYAKDLEAARQDARVAATPLVVRAVQARGTNKTDLVIRDADAQAVQQAAGSDRFLQECRVLILVD